jgi:hypothetical protein
MDGNCAEKAFSSHFFIGLRVEQDSKGGVCGAKSDENLMTG